ncbi:hypothetical protein RGQ15_11085 [Paracoccus sp. MBLB3053]|uniref:Uncharacterized protein n=1 Tax=Paracoccus aurantius TaxID=3073814 RepID=A0ABU2HUA9_9RHOB|nr:hypothetical protein [Paracoccus sp. MBLB3053]MDS9468110.1 hypothetical protein [Paracoccus sp. MBLB3053]
MPNKASVSGILVDATLSPIAAGKIVATLNGSDMFEGGLRIVTQKVEATTNQSGEWSVDLIVNGEGEAATTSWTIEGYNQFVVKVFESKSLFIASPLPVSLGELEKTSGQNQKAAKDAGAARLLVVSRFAEYEELPAAQKRHNDIILVKGD